MARLEFPRMVYHKKNGSHIIVNNADDLEIALHGNYQKQPLPAVAVLTANELIEARSKALDEREVLLNEVEQALTVRSKALDEREQNIKAKSAR